MKTTSLFIYPNLNIVISYLIYNRNYITILKILEKPGGKIQRLINVLFLHILEALLKLITWVLTGNISCSNIHLKIKKLTTVNIFVIMADLY
jgi:hypothetical protein